MDFIENAASKYMKGHGGSENSGSGDVDWSHLSGLANQFGKADQETKGDLDVSSFKSFLGGFGGSGGSAAAAPPQPGSNKPAGYPSAGSGGVPNTNVINHLLGAYQQQTGEPFQGEESQYHKLEEIAYKLSGSKIPLPILKKMVSWKLKGLV